MTESQDPFGDLPYEHLESPHYTGGHFAAALQRTIRRIEQQQGECDPMSFRFVRSQFLFLFMGATDESGPVHFAMQELLAELHEIGDALELGDGEPRTQTDEAISNDVLQTLGDWLDRYQSAILDDIPSDEELE